MGCLCRHDALGRTYESAPHMDDQLVKIQIFTEAYAPEAYIQNVTRTQGLNYDTDDAYKERAMAIHHLS